MAARTKRLAKGLVRGEDGVVRCFWHGGHDDYVAYHDHEWGYPVSEDRRLYEKLCLEGFQSGLSWLTILRKREAFRKAFRNFEVAKVARFGPRDVERLLQNDGIVRHRGKIEAAIENARCVRGLQKSEGSLAAFVWRFEPKQGSRPKRLTRSALTKMAWTDESTALSKELKKRGFRFVGPTTAYAFMQSMGLVNDHLEGCAFREKVEEARRMFERPSRD